MCKLYVSYFVIFSQSVFFRRDLAHVLTLQWRALKALMWQWILQRHQREVQRDWKASAENAETTESSIDVSSNEETTTWSATKEASLNMLMMTTYIFSIYVTANRRGRRQLAWRETRGRWMLYMRLDTCLICNNFPCLVLSLRHHPFCHRHELPEEREKTRERSPASPSKEFRRFAVT